MHLKRRISELGLDTSHFKGKGSWGRRGVSPVKKRPDEILVRQEKHEHKTRASMIRRAMMEAGKPYRCAGCGRGPEWRGEPLNLQVHHKNGDNRDHRRKNLEFLCPNCHSQTPNYGNRG
jgi:5-methylcytosine-specific restriction endonuclease McrA